MRAYRMHDADGELQIQLTDAPRPEVGPGQLLVRVRAAGLNRGEFIAGHGLKPVGGVTRPVGGEASGVVVGVGPGVEGWKLGDRAMGRCPGAFADYALMDRREALAVPEALDWTQAAAIPLTFLVAYDMLVLQGRLRAGETVLVAGVSSGVGVATLLAAKAIGARVIGTSGSADKLALLKPHGLDMGIVTPHVGLAEAVFGATSGRGADLAVNAVGGSVFAELVQSLGFQGRLAMVGYVDGVLRAEIDLEALHAKRLRVFGVSNKLRMAEQRAEPVIGFKSDWLPRMARGELRPMVDRSFAFDQLHQARACMEAGEHVGKIVLLGRHAD